MGLIKFELKKEHLMLLKHLKWSIKDNIINSLEDDNSIEIKDPFGGHDIYESIDLILNGKPDDFNPLEADMAIEYQDEDKEKWLKLFNELPMALDLILYNGHFNLGHYKTKFYDRTWVKIKE